MRGFGGMLACVLMFGCSRFGSDGPNDSGATNPSGATDGGAADGGPVTDGGPATDGAAPAVDADAPLTTACRTCEATETCCIIGANKTCVGEGTATNNNCLVAGPCAAPRDCADPAMQCCFSGPGVSGGGLYGATSCAVKCQQRVVCSTSTDCAPPKTCKIETFLGMNLGIKSCQD